MSKSFDYAKEITIASIAPRPSPDKADANRINEFFETVYTKLKEIEAKETNQ